MTAIRNLVVLILFIFIGLLGYGYYTSDTFVERPVPPPELRKTYLDGSTVSKEKVQRYVKDLNEYMIVLQQYTTRVNNVYLDKNERLAMSRLDECKIYQYIFKAIEIPPIPNFKSQVKDAVLLELADHIEELRARIHRNNDYIQELKDRYKSCK